MKLERSNIEFPLWRKKVDNPILEDNETPIPKFLWKLWDIENLFNSCKNSKDPKGKIEIIFNKKKYIGIIHIKSNKQYKLVIPKELANELKSIYVMSYMRFIEDRLRQNNPIYKDIKIEDEIPFWEFYRFWFISS